MTRGVHTEFDESFFDVIGPSQAWVLGLLASDGCVRGDRHVHFAQSGPEGLKIVEKVARLLDYRAEIGHNKTSRQDQHRLWFTSRRVVERLSDFNIVPQKSLVYRFPDSLPTELVGSFASGYTDGDGCVGVYDYGNAFTLMLSVVGTEQFVTQLTDRTPCPKQPRKLKAENCWELRWYGKKAILVGEWMWGQSPVFPSRKFRVFRDWADGRRPKKVPC